MRKFKVVICSEGNDDHEEVFRVDDDATPEEIEHIAEQIFYDYCGYYHFEIEDEDED